MAVGMASLNRRIVVVDADLGGANLHSVLGVTRPARTIQDFFEDKLSGLDSLLIEHPQLEGLRVLCGSPGAYGTANLNFQQKAKFIRHLRRLDADFVILDLGAGTHYNILDFFIAADLMVVLVNPDPLSILDAYGFVKQSLYRRMSLTLHDHPQAVDIVLRRAKAGTFDGVTLHELESEIAKADPSASAIVQDVLDRFRPALIINKMRSTDDESEGLAVKIAAQDLLSVQMDYLGHIHFDDAVSDAIKKTQPFLKYQPKAQASRDLAEIIISRILYRKKIEALLDRKTVHKRLREKWDLRKTAVFCSVGCLYWEECEYKQGGFPCKMQHLVNFGGFQK
jgi:flagellar biosynthesis protein FlhG